MCGGGGGGRGEENASCVKKMKYQCQKMINVLRVGEKNIIFHVGPLLSFFRTIINVWSFLFVFNYYLLF